VWWHRSEQLINYLKPFPFATSNFQLELKEYFEHGVVSSHVLLAASATLMAVAAVGSLIATSTPNTQPPLNTKIAPRKFDSGTRGCTSPTSWKNHASADTVVTRLHNPQIETTGVFLVSPSHVVRHILATSQ
jgi:hypothetical protein